MARRHGVDRMCKKHIAEHLRCGMGTVNYHWKTMAALREAVIEIARSENDSALLTGTLRRK